MRETKIAEIVKPGQPLGKTELERLRQLWVETYLALMVITTKVENKALRHMQNKLAEANEAVANFFDAELKRR